jgi:hypothetical protein
VLISILKKKKRNTKVTEDMAIRRGNLFSRIKVASLFSLKRK